MSANQKIMDAIVKHEIDMNRLRDTDVSYLIGVYLDLVENIRLKLREIDPTSPTQVTYKEKRLEALLEQVDDMVDNYLGGEMPREHYDMMTRHANVEADTFPTLFNNAIGIEVMTVGLPASLISNIVNTTMIDGRVVKDWWDKQANDFKFRFRSEMQQGMLSGETLNQLVTRVNQNVAVVPKNHAEALARTGLQSVVQKTRGEMYEENSDIIKGIEWLSTLDTRTSPICRALDGQSWYLPDFKLWRATRKFPGYPPAHWNCRSTTTPITKSFEELMEPGGNKKLAKELDKPDKTAQRAALDGTVPKSTNYDQWLKQQPPEVQKEVLGEKTYQLWKDGKITSTKQLIDRSGNPLTYEQLYQKYGVKKPAPKPKPKPKP